jgi:hypothetical protein
MFLWIFSHSFFQKWILFGWNIPAFTLTVHWQPLNSDWTVCKMCIFLFFCKFKIFEFEIHTVQFWLNGHWCADCVDL